MSLCTCAHTHTHTYTHIHTHTRMHTHARTHTHMQVIAFSPPSRHANAGQYSLAVSDFSQALKTKPNHKNASKYLVETEVTWAKE